MDPSVQSRKAELRKRLRRVLAGLSAEQWRQGSEQVCRRLMESIAMARRDGQALPQTIMFYKATDREIDIGPAAQECLRQGLAVCLPRADWDRSHITPALISTWGEDLVESKHGIFEPSPNAKPVDLARLTMVMVPGLAFDARGGRLGKGGGFYDRFLSQPGVGSDWGGAARVGVGLDEQVVEDIPKDSWDIALDALVTPTRTMVFARSGAGR